MAESGWALWIHLVHPADTQSRGPVQLLKVSKDNLLDKPALGQPDNKYVYSDVF